MDGSVVKELSKQMKICVFFRKVNLILSCKYMFYALFYFN